MTELTLIINRLLLETKFQSKRLSLTIRLFNTLATTLSKFLTLIINKSNIELTMSLTLDTSKRSNKSLLTILISKHLNFIANFYIISYYIITLFNNQSLISVPTKGSPSQWLNWKSTQLSISIWKPK